MIDLVYESKEFVKFWRWSDVRDRLRITFSLPHHCKQGIILDVLAFLMQSLDTFHETWQNDKGMNPLHFGSDPADISIQVQIW